MNKKWKIWLSVVGMLALYVVAGVLQLEQWMTSENTALLHPETPAVTVPAIAPQLLTIKNDYFTTTLPADFSMKRQDEALTSDPLLQLLATTPSTTDEQFTASYSLLPAGGIASTGDYNLRASQTNTYTPVTLKDLPVGSSAFQTLRGPISIVVFWPHGNHYIEMAVSTDGAASFDQLQMIFSQVMHSWQWN